MRPIRPKLTIFRAILAVAVAAILCFVLTEPIKRRALDRHHRLLQIAASHGSLAGEYARNSAGSPGMLKIAAWHDHMRREFERAAGRPDELPPTSRPFPPEGWTTGRAPDSEGASVGTVETR